MLFRNHELLHLVGITIRLALEMIRIFKKLGELHYVLLV